MTDRQRLLETIFCPGEDLSPLACVTLDARVSRKDLLSKAYRLSKVIRSQANHRPVVVLGHKSPDMIASFVGCILAGVAYVPVDQSIPSNRLNSIVNDSKSQFLILAQSATTDSSDHHTNSALVRGLPTHVCVYNSSEANFLPPSPPLELVENGNSANDVAYIMFTSGSTGKPKGIQVTYANLWDFVNWIGVDILPSNSSHTVLNHVLYCFDVSLYEIMACLCFGYKMVSLDHKLNYHSKGAIDLIAQEEVEYWVSTPSLVKNYIKNKEFNYESMPHLKTFIFCGEVLEKELVHELSTRFPGAKILNTYGPTESTVAVTHLEVDLAKFHKNKSIPLGHVRKNTHIEIRNKNGEAIPCGQVGEIVISGKSVAKGYCDPKVTSGFQHNTSGSSYCTGDSGYFSEEGILHFVGREDRQIKINGHRIELLEVEQVAIRTPQVFSAISYVGSQSGRAKRIFLAILIKDSSESILQELTDNLGQNLPSYMSPNRIWQFSEFPLNLNGKVDRKALLSKIHKHYPESQLWNLN